MAGSPEVDPTRRRSVQHAWTRSQLLNYDRRAFARREHAMTNLTEYILLPAGRSVGPIYHHYRAKTDLFLAIPEEHGPTFPRMIHGANRLRDGMDQSRERSRLIEGLVRFSLCGLSAPFGAAATTRRRSI